MQAPPKRKTPAKRATRLATLFASGFNALQQGEEGEPVEEERTNRDAFWHGFGGTSKVRPPPGPLCGRAARICCTDMCKAFSGRSLLLTPTIQLDQLVYILVETSTTEQD